MKKLYNYLLFALFSLSIVSCDKDEEEVVHLTNQDPVVTVTEISPVKGYVDTEFAITGTNFGVVPEDVEVYLGKTKLELISCEDQRLTVRVLEGATLGNISVVVYGQKVDTRLEYDVLGEPGVRDISPVYGFVGDEITFTGHDLGVSSAYYTILFAGQTETALLMNEPGDETFTVKVPAGAKSGEIALAIMDKNVNVSKQFTVLEHASLEKLSLSQGFAGSEVTVTGAHLNPEILEKEGLELRGVKVCFKQGKNDPVEAELVGEAKDTEIRVKVPANLEAGEYQVIVSTSFEDIKETLAYTVLPAPEVTGLSISAGYINAEVIIKGKNFGTKAEDIQVLFGETACNNVTLNEEGNIVVNVPKGLTKGENTIKLIILDTEISMNGNDTFEVWETPEILSVNSSYVYPYGTLVVAGEEITFAGHGFGTSKDAVTVTFDGVTVPAEINSITPTAIAVNVPNGFKGGKVTMVFDGIDEPVVSDHLQLLPEDGDITPYVLKNYKHEFLVIEGSAARQGEWHKPQDWEVENVLADGKLVGVQYQNKKNDVTSLAMQTDWGFPTTMSNGKIWQVTALSAGQYKVSVNVREINISGSVHIVVAEGETIPNTDDVETGKANVRISAVGNASTSLFTLDKSSTVSIGFVSTITAKQKYVKIESFKVELVK
jgi:hypothetical protein